jgi:hypothetical protein
VAGVLDGLRATSPAKRPPMLWPSRTISVPYLVLGCSLAEHDSKHLCGAGIERISIPRAEFLSRKLDRLARLVSRIHLRVYNMRLAQSNDEEIVDMCWETLEASLVAHEPMDIHKQQGSTARWPGSRGV